MRRESVLTSSLASSQTGTSYNKTLKQTKEEDHSRTIRRVEDSESSPTRDEGTKSATAHANANSPNTTLSDDDTTLPTTSSVAAVSTSQSPTDPTSFKKSPAAASNIAPRIDTNLGDHRPQLHGHHSSVSTSSIPTPSQRNQKSGGFFALAAAALDKTLTPTIRTRSSTSTLGRLSIALDSPAISAEARSPTFKNPPNSSSVTSTSTLAPPLENRRSSSQLSLKKNDPISRPYSSTVPNRPPPVLLPGKDKMHQTSSRLLRMTDDERPFTKVSIASARTSCLY